MELNVFVERLDGSRKQIGGMTLFSWVCSADTPADSLKVRCLQQMEAEVVRIEVQSGGSSTTGEMRPYGLDCSGFVAWCFLQQGLTNEELESKVGLGTWAQWENSEEISWKELRVGDIVFQNSYPTNKGNHVGVCIGFNEKGKPVFAHCALGFDNVVVTPAGDVFHYARRPGFFS